MPYAPGITYHGDQYLYNAISGLGQQAGNAIGEYKKLKAGAKAADAMYEYLGLNAPQDPNADGERINPLGRKEQWDTLGARDKISKMEGFGLALGKKQAMQSLMMGALDLKQKQDGFPVEQAYKQSLTAGQNQRIAEGQREEAGAGALQEAMGDAGFRSNTMYGGFPSRNAPPPGREEMMSALGRHPAAMNAPANSVGGTYIRELMQNSGRDANAFFKPGDPAAQDIEGLPNWMRVVLGPNQSQVIQKPSDSVTATPIIGQNGEVLGYGTQGRSGLNQVRTEDASKGKITERDQFKSLDSLHREYVRNAGAALLPEQRQVWQQKADDIAAQMNEMVGTEAPGGKSGGKKAQGGYKIGSVYAGLKYLGGDPNVEANWERIK